MGHGRCQFDMTHALAAYFGLNDLNTAFFAHDTAVLHALVLTAQAFVILCRTEYAGAE